MGQATYEVRFQEQSRGRDGGLGRVKSFYTRAGSSKKALKKLRKKGRIISIRTI